MLTPWCESGGDPAPVGAGTVIVDRSRNVPFSSTPTPDDLVRIVAVVGMLPGITLVSEGLLDSIIPLAVVGMSLGTETPLEKTEVKGESEKAEGEGGRTVAPEAST